MCIWKNAAEAAPIWSAAVSAALDFVFQNTSTAAETVALQIIQTGDCDALSAESDLEHGRLHRQEETDADEALSAGADARAAARLQPHLHRLRPHPRVFTDHQGEADRRGVPRLG